MPYRISYAAETRQHLAALTATQRKRVFAEIKRQLTHEPTTPTRNRFRMRVSTLGSWELRVQPVRVYYDVVEDPEPTVQINAIGIKWRERVFIGGRGVPSDEED